MKTASPPSGPLPLLGITLILGGLAAAGLPSPASGQVGTDSNDIRIGLTTGGIGLVGVSVEFRWGDQSVDVNVATFSFHDASISVVGKHYLGGGDARPFVGVGLWGVLGRGEEGQGTVLLLRAPAGLDWRFAGDHFLGGAISINQALGVKRPDPGDDTPLSRRPIPLPGFYYRWRP